MRVNREDYFDAQPLRAASEGLVLVADCRLDNREELAERLGIDAEALATLADSALILRAYREWGGDCAERLLGAFAFALWDARKRELLIARDPMGERCVYYHHSEAVFVFATEIKALFAVEETPRRLSEREIGRHLMFQAPGVDGETFFEGVTFPFGGQTVRVGPQGALETTTYWEPRADPVHIGRDEAYYVATYRRLLTEAVDCRIRRAIAPPALMLSAGFDSAAIAGVAQPRLAAQGRKLLAFSSVLPADYVGPHGCVRHWVEACRRVMPHLDVRYFVQSDENVFSEFERICEASDAPPHNLHYLTDALYLRAAQAGARVMMDGFGGDLGLNPRLGNVLAHLLRQGRLLLFIREFAAQLRAGDNTFRRLAIDTTKQLIPDRIKRLKRMFRPPGHARFIAPRFAAELARSGAINVDDLYLGPRPDLSLHDKMQSALRGWARNNRRLNANEAAARGLELTRPLLDQRIVEFALAVPPEFWIKNGRPRYLARRALADVYPPQFQEREARQDSLEPERHRGLTSVLPRLRAEFRRLAEDPALRRYIDFDALQRGLDNLEPGSREAVLVARAVSLAKFVEWMRAGNRTGR